MIVTIKKCQLCGYFKVFEASERYIYCEVCRNNPIVDKIKNRDVKLSRIFKRNIFSKIKEFLN